MYSSTYQYVVRLRVIGRIRKKKRLLVVLLPIKEIQVELQPKRDLESKVG